MYHTSGLLEENTKNKEIGHTEYFSTLQTNGEKSNKAISKKSCISNAPSKNLCLIINRSCKVNNLAMPEESESL